MIGISIAAEKEWEAVLDFYNIKQHELNQYPFGEFFEKQIAGVNVIFYFCGTRKVNSAATTQYMISVLNVTKVIVLGTCAGINDTYNMLDIFIPTKTVQYDCTVKEIEPFIKERFTINLDVKDYPFSYYTGTIGTADKAVVMWKDYVELKENKIDIADTESGAIAYVCNRNNVTCVIAKGISDFPIEEDHLNEEQINVYLNNIPIVMNKLLDTYLQELIK